MKILYFTATGNCLSIAKQLATNEDSLVSIPHIKAPTHFDDEVLGIVIPIYSFGLPLLVKNFLNQITIKSNYFFVIGTYGNMDGGFCKTVYQLLKKKGIVLDYCNTIKMVDNYLGIFDMDHERSILPEKKIPEQLLAIKSDITSKKRFIKATNKKAGFLNLIAKAFSFLDNPGSAQKIIYADASCTKCGICTRVCPCRNVTIEGKVTIGKYCTKCLGCIHNCPIHALHLKREKSTARWRNPDVSLKEIIDSNNQL
ncbi:MAG: EFR1 family ferrodoxin [Christensenellaceae bacterium]|jgi:ferredoxin|nr:EFR1 family ferrodoxin [Christensenellaceae bacterium]